MISELVYLDNAASSFPKPRCVTEEMNRIMRQNTSNPGRSGHRMSNENAAVVYNARKTASKYFADGSSPENVIFTHNATHSINIAVNGISEKGDEIIISDMEHNSVLRPLAELEKNGIIRLCVAEVSTDDGETVENFRKQITSRTKAVFVTHASNVNGKILPVKDISNLCKEYGIIFCVDASQTAGHLNCNLDDLGADILCTAGHKGLLGPQGTGLLILKGTVFPKPLIFGGTGGSSLIKTQPPIYPEALESGTMNTVGIAGLDMGMKFVMENGDRLERKADALYKKAFDMFTDMKGITLYSERKNPTHALAFNIGDIPSEKVTQLLDGKGICVRGGYHCSALFHEKNRTTVQGTVRASFGIFNTEHDLKLFSNECFKIARGQ